MALRARLVHDVGVGGVWVFIASAALFERNNWLVIVCVTVIVGFFGIVIFMGVSKGFAVRVRVGVRFAVGVGFRFVILWFLLSIGVLPVGGFIFHQSRLKFPAFVRCDDNSQIFKPDRDCLGSENETFNAKATFGLRACLPHLWGHLIL